MRRLALLLVVAAAALAPTAWAAEPQSGLTQAGGSIFPSRAFVLTLPKSMQLSADRVHVLENGKPVVDLQVIAAGDASQGSFGVVLAIDASDSMRGAPISGAVEAAKAFLVERLPNQQVAILTFNKQTNILTKFTTDPATLGHALESTPRLAVGTHIYDAVRDAIDLLAKGNVKAGSIVVLSDGSDTGSTATRAAVARAAREAHIRVFTVGLRSEQFSAGTLQSLADQTGAEYAEADAASDLARIYRRLGSQLSREYLVSYRSLAGPGLKVNVGVTVDGVAGSSAASYSTPALPIAPVPPYYRSGIDKIIQSSLLPVLIALLGAGLISLGLWAVLQPRKRDVRDRVAEFVSIGHGRDGEEHSALTERVFEGAEKGLERTRWWAGFKEQLELAEIRMPAVQVVLWVVVGAFAVAWLFVSFTGHALFGIVGLFVPLLAREVIQLKVQRKRSLFAEQLPDNLQVLASALRAGHSLVGALSVVVDDAAEPTKSEFRRVIADERLGVPLENALAVVVRRMDSKDLQQVALVAALQRQTGGNAAEVIDRVVHTLRERADLRRLVKTLTTQGRMARWILTAIPIFLAGAVSVLSPGYLNPLFQTSSGRLALAGAAVMLITGSLIIRKIINIKL